MNEIVAAVKKIDKTIAKKTSEFEIVKSTYFLKPYPFSLKRVQYINDYKTEIDRLNRKRKNLIKTLLDS